MPGGNFSLTTQAFRIIGETSKDCIYLVDRHFYLPEMTYENIGTEI
jgi:hypothetical protein